MSERIAVTLENIQKTLLLPLWGRAHETRKPHPLLVDEAAVEISEKLDYNFAALAKAMSAITQLAWIARSLHIDRAIEDFLRAHPRGTIVNIGCGLDTTFERVDNGSLVWYDLDLPDVIALRSALVPEGERRRYLACSFLEESWFSNVRTEDSVFFVAAGVLYYFAEKGNSCPDAAIPAWQPDGGCISCISAA